MGSHFSQSGVVDLDLGTLWDKVPAGGEVIITRDKITISDSPKLDIGKGVLTNDLTPNAGGKLMVSLSDLHYGDDSETILSPNFKDRNRKHVEEKKLGQSNSGFLLKQAISPRSEFIPELTAAGIFHHSTQSKMVESATFSTPETQSDDSDEYGSRFSKPPYSIFQLPALNVDGQDCLSDRSLTTCFTTRSMAEENVKDLQNFLKQHLGSSPSMEERNSETEPVKVISASGCSNDRTNEDKVGLVRVERRNSKVLQNEQGVLLTKKLATQLEQKGMRECHVYFTPRTSAEIWPPLIVTVGEEWDFVKVMRKSIAELQRCINKGDRDGTHDWLFDYHPNKNIKEIKNDLKVLLGPKVISFRGSHLKKCLKDVTADFINKVWILQKEDDKHYKQRIRSSSLLKATGKIGSPRSLNYSKARPKSLARSKSITKTNNRKSVRKRYSRLSHRL